MNKRIKKFKKYKQECNILAATCALRHSSMILDKTCGDTYWNFEVKTYVCSSQMIKFTIFILNPSPSLPRSNVDIIRKSHVVSIGIIPHKIEWGGGGGGQRLQTLGTWYIITHVSQTNSCARLWLCTEYTSVFHIQLRKMADEYILERFFFGGGADFYKTVLLHGRKRCFCSSE